MNIFKRRRKVLNGEFFVLEKGRFKYYGDESKILFEDAVDRMAVVPLTEVERLKAAGINYRIVGDEAVILPDNYHEEELTLPTRVWLEDKQYYVEADTKKYTGLVIDKAEIEKSKLTFNEYCSSIKMLKTTKTATRTSKKTKNLNAELLAASKEIKLAAGKFFEITHNNEEGKLSPFHTPGEKIISGKKYFLFRVCGGYVLFKHKNFKDGRGTLLVPRTISLAELYGSQKENIKYWEKKMGVWYINVVQKIY